MAKKSENFAALYTIIVKDDPSIKNYMYSGFVPINDNFKLTYIRLYNDLAVIKDSPLDLFMQNLVINPSLVNDKASIQFQSTEDILAFI